MTIENGNQDPLRVTFKDYGFFVPKSGVENKMATFSGVCMRKEQSVDELRHYAEDEGKSKEEIEAITEPLITYAFEAEGVTIAN